MFYLGVLCNPSLLINSPVLSPAGVVYQINQLAADPTAPSPSPVGAGGAAGAAGAGGGGSELCAAGPSSASLPAYLETPPPTAAGDEATNL